MEDARHANGHTICPTQLEHNALREDQLNATALVNKHNKDMLAKDAQQVTSRMLTNHLNALLHSMLVIPIKSEDQLMPTTVEGAETANGQDISQMPNKHNAF